jgi:hypothetical protein
MALIELYLKSPYKLYEFALVLKSNNKAETLASLKLPFRVVFVLINDTDEFCLKRWSNTKTL